MAKKTFIRLMDAEASYYTLGDVTAAQVVEALVRDGYYKIDWKPTGLETFILASGVCQVEELDMDE